MPGYVCLLRGINVGGHNKIKMADLKEALTKIKLKNILTYIQSGNLIFEGARSKPQTIANKVKKRIFEVFEIDVPVLCVTLEDFQTIARKHPFENKASEIKHLHVTFLREEPQRKLLNQLKKTTADFPDEYSLGQRCVYLHCPTGYLKTKLTNNFFEKQLAVSATTRNWNTISKMNALIRSAN